MSLIICLLKLRQQPIQSQVKVWSWFAGADKPGVFEIDWQNHNSGNIDRIGMALECRSVGVIDLRKVAAISNSWKS